MVLDSLGMAILAFDMLSSHRLARSVYRRATRRSLLPSFDQACHPCRMAMQTLAGSCHCGKVRFEVQAAPDAGTGSCNCTFCTKKALWSLRSRSPKDFKLLSSPDDLGDYSKADFGHY